MEGMKIRQAWGRFKEKMNALRKRQTESLRRFSARADEKRLRELRERLEKEIT